jgi:hypothetical protein
MTTTEEELESCAAMLVRGHVRQFLEVSHHGISAPQNFEFRFLSSLFVKRDE